MLVNILIKNFLLILHYEKINKTINKIVNFFYENEIKSACLAQSYILYEYFLKLKLKPKLIKGYIVNDIDKIYYGHFWVECNNKILDISTLTYLKFIPKYFNKEEIMNKRKLCKCMDILKSLYYQNIDSINFNEIRDYAYNMCIKRKMFEDEYFINSQYYDKIKNIYNEIINNTYSNVKLYENNSDSEINNEDYENNMKLYYENDF